MVFEPNTASTFSISPLTGDDSIGEEQIMVQSPNLKLKFYGGNEDLCFLMIEYEPEEEEFIVVKEEQESLYKYVSPNAPLLISMLSNNGLAKKNELFQEFCSEEARAVSDFQDLVNRLNDLELEMSDFSLMNASEKLPRFANQTKDYKELWEGRNPLFINQSILGAMDDFEFPTYNDTIDDVEEFVKIQVNTLGDQIKDFLSKNPTMKKQENEEGVAKVVKELDEILLEMSGHLKTNFEQFGYIENRKAILADYVNSFQPLLKNKLLFFFSMMKKLRDTEYYEERDCSVDKMLKKIHIGSESTELNDEFLRKSLYTFGYYLISLYFHNYNIMFTSQEDEFMIEKYKQIEGLISKNMPDLNPDRELSEQISVKFTKTIRLYKLIDPTVKQMKIDFIRFVKLYVDKLFEVNEAGLIDLLKSLWSDKDAMENILKMLGSGSQMNDGKSYAFDLVLFEDKVRRVLV
jgi:hypothetical protein